MRSFSLLFNRTAKSILLVLSLLIFSGLSANAQDVAAGGAIFKGKCSSCHSIGKGVVTGPDLQGVNDRHSEEWLIKWIKNAPAMIASGDPEAKKLENFAPSQMTVFAELSDDDVKNVLAYIANPPAPAKTETATVAEEGVSGLMLWGLVAVVAIALFVVIVLSRVSQNLERMILEKKGLLPVDAVAEESAMAKIKRLAKNKKFVFFVVLLLVIFMSTAGWKTMWNTGVHTGYQPEQPIKFPHDTHAGMLKIDCQYCHTGAGKSKNATIPSLNVCMNCHNYVTAADKYNGQTSPEIMKIYKALDYNPDTKVYGDNPKPVQWIRIHNLPDLAYFNHSQHVTVAGIECQKCHGPIETMPEVYQYSPLTMKWCINCHKETEVNSKGNAYYDKLIAAHEKLKKGEKITAAVLGGIECGKCHY